MIIPIANGIFEHDLEINKLLKNQKEIKNLTFEKPNKENFPIIEILNRVNEYPSTSIIVNASNEVLVDHFLRKKVPFLGIPLIIKKILRDRNYKKYAIRNPKDLEEINKINLWAKLKTLKKINNEYN
jgi:1-deoxy-D-xylulose-5-phosphate reductoisomerase